jgi:hypothetical protein
MTGPDIYKTLAVIGDRMEELSWEKEWEKTQEILRLLEDRLGLVLAQPAKLVGCELRPSRRGDMVCQLKFEGEGSPPSGTEVRSWSTKVINLVRSKEFDIVLEAARKQTGRTPVLVDSDLMWKDAERQMPSDSLVKKLDDLTSRAPRVMVLLTKQPLGGKNWDVLKIKGVAE